MGESIGVRELRQYASTYLARVKEGESITVTERGTPIARLVPIGEGTPDWYDDWAARGLLRPAAAPPSSWLAFDPMSLRLDDGTSALDELERQRRDRDELDD